jgi:hypothetical protein
MSKLFRNLSALTFIGLLAAGTTIAAADPPPAADTFEREALKVLQASHADNRGVVVHVDGQALGGVVKAIGPDVIVLANREHGTIVVRRERISAVLAN